MCPFKETSPGPVKAVNYDDNKQVQCVGRRGVGLQGVTQTPHRAVELFDLRGGGSFEALTSTFGLPHQRVLASVL